MRSAAAAIAWEFRARHRWGLIGLIGYLVVLAVIKLLIALKGQRIEFDDPLTFAFVVVVPATSTFIYFLAVFTFGLSGDIAARQSMYPRRMFALPVRTEALVGWPMVYGSTAMAALWFATRVFAIWPSAIAVPIVWPALLAASLLAWTQALTWMPYALPGLRVVVSVLWLVSIDAIVLVALHFKAPEPVMLAILAPHVPLAFFVARYAVARARRGDVPDWRAALARISGAERVPRQASRFRSPTRAQVWFEWRQHGRSLPLWVAILLPFELSMLFLFREAPVIIFETLIGVLLTPPFMAVFVAAKSQGLTSFLATRPLPNASFVSAKLRAAMGSALSSWLLVLVTVPLALILSGTWPVVIEHAGHAMSILGPPRAVAIAILALSALVVSTWKQLVQSLCIGESGRPWLVKGSVFFALALLTALGPIAHWVSNDRQVMTALWIGLPWIAAIFVGLKIAAGVWIATRLLRMRLAGIRTLIAAALCWDLAVFALYGLLAWILPELLVRSYVLALLAILAIPLVRVSAAPLALAWSRHR